MRALLRKIYNAESVYKYKWIILCNTDSQDGRSITLAVRSDAFNYTAVSPGVRFSGLTPYTACIREHDLFFPGNAVSTPFSSSYRVRVIARCTSRYASELSLIVRRENMKFRAGRSNFSISPLAPLNLPLPLCTVPPMHFFAPGPTRGIVNKMHSTGRRAARLKTRVGRECG